MRRPEDRGHNHLTTRDAGRTRDVFPTNSFPAELKSRPRNNTKRQEPARTFRAASFVPFRVISWTAVPSSGAGDRRERVEQFGLFAFRDGAQVEHDASVEYARDDGRRGAAQSLFERGGRERGVSEREERGRRVRGRGGAAADCGLAFDGFKGEGAVAEARAQAAAEGADAALDLA